MEDPTSNDPQESASLSPAVPSGEGQAAQPAPSTPRPQLQINVAGDPADISTSSPSESPSPAADGADTGDAAATAVEAVVERAGIDLGSLRKEVMERGDLSEDSYKRLEAIGFTRDVVQDHIAGQRAVAEKIQNDIASVVGTHDDMVALLQWGRHGLTDAEKAAWDSVLSTQDPGIIKLGLKAIEARYHAVNGRPPERMLHGTKAGPGPSDVFEDRDELQRAIADPRYKVDAKYRDEVIARLRRSSI